MLIFVLDDEQLLMEAALEAIREAVPEAEVVGFTDPRAILGKVSAGSRPDLCFTDIEMPGMDGVTFASLLQENSPQTKIVFVTAYPQYASDAYRMHASGYVLKPLDADRVREEIAHALGTASPQVQAPARLHARCFGYFEIFCDGEPVVFERRKTKELLAYLIDCAGAVCAAEDVIRALWGGLFDVPSAKNRLRVLVNDLSSTFAKLGVSDVLIRRSGQMGVRRELLDCDYYRLLAGDGDAQDAYRGEYMTQYDWAGPTAAKLSSAARRG